MMMIITITTKNGFILAKFEEGTETHMQKNISNEYIFAF